MADRSISISLEARVQGFVAGMRTAQQATSDFADRTADFARENEQNLDRVGKASILMGAGVLAGVGFAVKSFMDFDSAMSEVQASTHETAGNMELLREAAIGAGADTAFSAVEAAKGIDELAKAGVSTAEILSGGLTGALSLAAAGSLGVGDAAEIAATALTQFKLSGKDIPHLADLLAAGAGKAQGSVEDIGNALKQSGLVASQFGLSIEDTTGTLAAFASAGLVGSDSGTSLKTMLLKLAAPAKETALLMDELGIAAYDSSGSFVGITSLAGQLQDKLGGLTQAQRDSALATIFGTDAIRGANVLYEQGADGIDAWIDKVNEAGYAAVTASIKQDNLAGDIEKLGGSMDTVFIKGGSGVAEALRGMVQGAESLVDSIGKIPTPVLTAGAGIAGLAGGALVLGGTFMTLLPKFFEFRTSMQSLATNAPRTATALSRIGKAAGVAAAALVAMQVAAAVLTEKDTKTAEEYGQALLKVGGAAGAVNKSGLDSIFGSFDKINGTAVSEIDNLSDAVSRLTSQTFDDAGNKFFEPLTTFLGFPKGEIGQLEDRLNGVGEAMGGLVANGAPDVAAKSFQVLTDEFKKNGKGAKEALESVPGYKDALMALGNQAGVTFTEQELLDFALGKMPASLSAATTGVDVMNEAIAETGVQLDGVITDMDKFLEQLFATGLITMSARDANAAYHEALRGIPETLKDIAKSQGKMGRMLNDTATDFDTSTEAGAAANSAFQDVARKGMAEVEAKAKEGLGQEDLQKKLTGTYEDLVASADQMGIHGQAAVDLARDVLGIPDGVDINTWMSDQAKKVAEDTKTAIDNIPKQVNINIDTYKTTFEKLVGLPASVTAPTDTVGVYANPVKKATGGRVFGPGTSTSDSVPHMLSKDEYVIKASAAKAVGYGALDSLNTGDARPVAGFQYGPGSAPARQAAPSAAPSGLSVNLVQNINGTTEPREVANEAMGMIRWELQKQGVRLGG